MTMGIGYTSWAEIAGFLTGTVFEAIFICIILAIPTFAVMHFAKIKSKNTFTYLFIISILLSCLGTFARQFTKTGGHSSEHTFKYPEDLKRLNAIIVGVLNGSNDPTSPSIKTEFKTIIERNGYNEEGKKKELKRVALEPGVTYTKMLVEDAYDSIKEKKPIRSEKRDKLEKSLIERGLMPVSLSEKNKLFIQAAATGGTVSLPDGDIVVNEETLDLSKENLNKSEGRISDLFGP